MSIVPAHASEDLLHPFAHCAGRFSAEIQHAWLFEASDTATLERQRAAFVSLIDSVASKDDLRNALNMRISAKFAHAELLTQSSFSEDDTRRRTARERANWHLQQCTSLLLGG
ncbi:MAG: hypothetical protein JXR14_12610 [Paracoccaceae bacterium]